MRAPRWICNLAGAEASLSHCLPDTMGSKVDYQDDMEMHLDELADEDTSNPEVSEPKDTH